MHPHTLAYFAVPCALLLLIISPVLPFGSYGSVSCLFFFASALASLSVFSFLYAGYSHPTWSLSFVLVLMILLPLVLGVVEILQYDLAQQHSKTV